MKAHQVALAVLLRAVGLHPRTVPLMDTITDSARGTWLVRTAASTYVLDMDNRSGCRRPGSAATSLRNDGDSWVLVEVVSCTVGAPMLLVIKGLAAGGVATLRRTTDVLSIQRK